MKNKNILNHKIFKYLFSVIKLGVLFVVLVVLGVVAVNLLVVGTTKKHIYNSTSEIPHNNVGLLLGASKILPNGHINWYYKYRIDAALELFKSGKIDFILVSGDNGRTSYDEPTTIKNDLISGGVPASKIFLDYAGFRTLDSVVRSKEIFDQDSITVISQKFHNERAIFIAKSKGMKAVGFNAKNVSVSYGYPVLIRELMARVKMVLDLVFGKKPKFLGETIEIK